MSTLNTIKNFIEIQDWRLVVAGFGMIIIFVLMVYLLSVIVLSYKHRRDAVQVSLPEIDSSGLVSHDSVDKFKEADTLEIELISSDDDNVVVNDNFNIDDSLFLTALTVETKTFIPLAQEDMNMPDIGEIDYEGIKMKMEAEAEKRRKERLQRLKEIAKSDEQDLIDVSLINDGGAMDD